MHISQVVPDDGNGFILAKDNVTQNTRVETSSAPQNTNINFYLIILRYSLCYVWVVQKFFT